MKSLLLAISGAALLTLACGDSDEDGDLTVFAAASLTDSFQEIADAFSAGGITFNFAGSQELRAQLEQGAPADIFASANPTQMDLAREAGAISGEPQVFARNRLVVIVPSDNPAGIESLQDLASDGVRLVIAAEEVPAGQYSRSFVQKASTDPAFVADFGERVLQNVVSEETNVRQAAVKVQLGEADAGIVYSTDVTGDLADDVIRIEIPDSLNELAEYQIAAASAGEDALAQQFIDFVLSEAGQDILEKHGFIRVDR